MTAVPDTRLTRAIPHAGRSIRPRRVLVRVSLGVGTYDILVASPLGDPSETDGGLYRRLGQVWGPNFGPSGHQAPPASPKMTNNYSEHYYYKYTIESIIISIIIIWIILIAVRVRLRLPVAHRCLRMRARSLRLAGADRG